MDHNSRTSCHLSSERCCGAMGSRVLTGIEFSDGFEIDSDNVPIYNISFNSGLRRIIFDLNSQHKFNHLRTTNHVGHETRLS